MTWTSKELAKMDERVLELSDNDFVEYTKTKLQGLPRAQRRAKERELKDNMSVMKTLNPKQVRLMVDCVNSACGRAVQEEMDKYNIMMDTAITAYLYTKYPDMTIEQAREEQEIIAEIITEDLTKYMERLKKEGGNEDMANKKVNKLEPEVRALAVELIDKGFNQGQAIKELCIKFPTLSRSMLTNAFKKVKEERRVQTEAQALEVATEVIEAAEYIFGEENKQEEVVELDAEIEETIGAIREDEEYKDMLDHSKEIESPITVDEKVPFSNNKKVKEEIQPALEEMTITVEKDDCELKIISKQIEVEGKFNKYIVNTDNVTVGAKSFKNMEDVESYINEQIELFNKEMAELKKVVGMI